MDFELSDEQRALQDSLARLLADRHDAETRRRIAAGEAGWSEPLWRQLVDLGLSALPVAAVHGGLGGRTEDLMVAMMEIGRSLLSVPLLGGVAMPAAALQAAGGEAAARWLPALAAGEALLAWVHDEPEGDGSAEWVALRARRDGDAWWLEGRKSAVQHAGSARHLLVSARVAGEDGDAAGRALFLVAADAPGVQRRALRLIDGTPACEFTLDGVVAEPLTLDGDTVAHGIDAALAVGVAGACAELLGAMEYALRLTIDYVQTRKQFGRLIGDNQALRHALADMQVSLEMARSMALLAAVQADRPASADARVDLHRAKLVVDRHARLVAEAAIQLHGGIGMTEEYAVGNVLRRVLVLETSCGDADTHVAAIDRSAAWNTAPLGANGSG
jgi:pimeloyl-CoA dehydrogenase